MKCITCNVKLFVDFVVSLGEKREWKSSSVGPFQLQTGGDFSSEMVSLLHCSAAYLHLTFNSSHEAGRTSLSLKESQPNTLILTHPSKHKHH